MTKTHVAKFKTLKYTATALLLALFAILTLATPALAWSPPSQSTDNATDVILWPADNFTIESINGTLTLTISGLNDAVENAAEAHALALADGLMDVVTYAVTFLLLVILVAFAFWKNIKVMYALSGLGFVAYGFPLWSVNEWLSIITVIAGMVIFIRTFGKAGKE